ncbi:MAG TPA: YdcF family protein [Coleofasciculaceae cyanobacterium]|jgi:uncharacterized SAM-binding protein YcdF (DUF218 family)
MLKSVSPVRVIISGILLSLVLLILGVFSPTIDLLSRPLKVESQRQPADVVVAVSAGLLKDCRGHPHLFLREGYSAMLVQSGYSRSGKLLISGVYTDPNRVSLSECRLRMAKLIGIAPERLILDNQAHTTLENARNTRKMMAEHGWKNVMLVTSRSHMFRALGVFRKQGITAYPVSIPELPPYGNAWFSANRLSHLKRFLYEYGALLKYKWYGYI